MDSIHRIKTNMKEVETYISLSPSLYFCCSLFFLYHFAAWKFFHFAMDSIINYVRRDTSPLDLHQCFIIICYLFHFIARSWFKLLFFFVNICARMECIEKRWTIRVISIQCLAPATSLWNVKFELETPYWKCSGRFECSTRFHEVKHRELPRYDLDGAGAA